VTLPPGSSRMQPLTALRSRGKRNWTQRRGKRCSISSGSNCWATTPIRSSRPWRRRSRTTRHRLPHGGGRRRGLPGRPRPGRKRGPGEDAGDDQASNLTLRKLPKGERASLYTLLVAGHVLVTLREAFEVVPVINAARVVVLRNGGTDAYGKGRLECIMAGRWTRAAFSGVRWQKTDVATIRQDIASELTANIRRSQLLPIDLFKEPEIARALAGIDTTGLLSS